MTITASDLPSDVKQGLLNRIREQIGQEKYREMVDVLGEDKVLDMVLEKTNSKSESSWTWKEILGVIVFFSFWGAVGYQDGGGIGGVLGGIVFGVLVTSPGLIWLLIKWLAKPLGIGLAAVLGIGVGGAVLFGLWKAVAYTGAGTAGWFKWLFGHF
jgi:hypothetical protein